jgi:hypothetical protein
LSLTCLPPLHDCLAAPPFSMTHQAKLCIVSLEYWTRRAILAVAPLPAWPVRPMTIDYDRGSLGSMNWGFKRGLRRGGATAVVKCTWLRMRSG